MPHLSDSRERKGGRAIIALLLTVLALSAGVLALAKPSWLPLDDRTKIGLERWQRRLRADLDLPMPGQPDLARLSQRLADAGVAEGAPILLRIYKKEFELELWMQQAGKFKRFAVYPICRWSGRLGPKLQQGDAQAPEGFYTVDQSALNPNSRWHRSFNLGYPNLFDQSHGRTGSLIMVHGGCASIGCFAMTNAQIDEIWQLVTAALNGGQKRFQVQVFPFRMTDAAMANAENRADAAFWRDLKAGSDLFETSFVPPKPMLCEGRYRFEPGEAGSKGDAAIETRCPGQPAKS